jgi:hypothetical protein
MTPNNLTDFPTQDTALIGATGVHYVVSELSLRGMIALPTIHNTAGVDVVVTNAQLGPPARGWPLSSVLSPRFRGEL